jgi:hypothetical protein
MNIGTESTNFEGQFLDLFSHSVDHSLQVTCLALKVVDLFPCLHSEGVFAAPDRSDSGSDSIERRKTHPDPILQVWNAFLDDSLILLGRLDGVCPNSGYQGR